MAARNRGGAASAEETEIPVPEGKKRWAQGTATPLAVLSCLLFCCNGELLQALQHLDPAEGRPSPLVNLALCHLGGLVFFPQAMRTEVNFSGELDLRLSSFLVAILIMAYNYAWLMSARYISISLTTAIFRTSVGMMYCASVLIFSEPLAAGRVFGVFMSFVGMGLATGITVTNEGGLTGYGVGLSLLAAAGVTAYQVAFKYLYSHRGSDMSFLMRFNFWISAWHLLAVLPAIKLADVSGIEALELPAGRTAVSGTIASAVIASAVNMMNLAVVQLGSPMLLPCAYNLSVPLSIYLDALLYGLLPQMKEALGHVLIVVSVVLILDVPVGSWLARVRVWRQWKGSSVAVPSLDL